MNVIMVLKGVIGIRSTMIKLKSCLFMTNKVNFRLLRSMYITDRDEDVRSIVRSKQAFSTVLLALDDHRCAFSHIV